MPVHIQELLTILNERHGSDLHIKSNAPAMVRVGDELQSATSEVLSQAQVEDLAKEVLGAANWDRFLKEREFDIAVQMPGYGRYRVNAFFQRGLVGMVFRRVKSVIPSIGSIQMPSVVPILKEIALETSGLIIVCGPCGCGKSTTLAAMLDWINEQRQVHILTIEDPVEYLFADKQGLVNQREIGIDTDDFLGALRYCMRQDPDVIMIGEMRDRESLMAGMHAAETGHLVLTTLHTSDAAGIMPRILDMFDMDHQAQVRTQLASVFKAGICQRLVPSCKEGQTVIPSIEIIRGTPTVKKLIRENNFDKLYAAIETGGEFGMRTFNQSLLELVKSEMISEEQALAQSLHPAQLRMNLQGIFLDESKRILNTD